MRLQQYAIALAIMAVPLPALAADPPKPASGQPQSSALPSPWSARISVGGAMMPEFQGSKHYRYLPFVSANIAYEKYYVDFTGMGAKFNVVNSPMFEAGPMIGYNMGRDNDMENRRLRLLPKVKGTVEFGGFVKVNFKQVMLQNDSLSFGADFMMAPEGHKGYRASLQASYGIQVTKPLFVSLDAKMTFADKKYMNAFFGVTPAGAAATGLSAFAASAGVSRADIGLSARYALTQNWGVTGRVGYGRLLGDAAKSPIVKREGTANQFMSTVGVTYRF
jgi:MipA family protein